VKKSYAVLVAIFCLIIAGCVPKGADMLETQQSFFKQVGETDWQLGLKDFAVSLEKEGTVFELRMQGYSYVRFNAKPKGADRSEQIAPLKAEHVPELAALLEYALFYVEKQRNDDFALRVNWEMYPQSILHWAKVWQASDLRKKKKSMNQHEHYQKLMTAIGEVVSKDMQDLVQGLGFEPDGASMEKMNYSRADRLSYYKEILEPANIPADLRIPIPLMLSLKLKPMQVVEPITVSQFPISVDYLFATAEANSATVYATFQRALDEYEVTGDVKTPEGGYNRILPMLQQEYQPIAGQLFQTMLKTTKGDERKSFSIRLNLSMYPKVYDEVVQRFNLSPGVTQKVAMPRQELPNRQFHEYEPLPASDLQLAVNPFLEKHGYHFKYLLISVERRLKASEHVNYELDFKPAGMKPDDKLLVPDIVYMVVEKK
jgi:hypothetical protein